MHRLQFTNVRIPLPPAEAAQTDMMFNPRPAVLLLAFFVLSPLLEAQVTITNGVQKYAALAGTTVTLSGKSELWVTNSTTPLSGCIINLTSPDAWLFLSGIKPSAVVSSYLSQIRVSGASAVADSNVRVVQYGQSGAVIIPHPPSFQPLQAFSGPNFTGTAAQYSQYVYHTGGALGAMDMNISSFRLKRGYMAVLAQNTSGSGISKCYVAQDGDLEIGVLPSNLDNKVRFIYITPWRWVSKKGIAGNIEGPLGVLWKYNWNLDQNSTRDLEYVAIRQTQWWPGLGQNWQSRGINTLLGYNEPDKSDQANMTVSTALSAWPDLLSTGLRVGSPAVTDGGRNSWLYPFMQQADASGLRVDFVAIHYYWCYDPANPSGAASQMYNFLKAVYDQTRRPIWITEWNNGANWTGCGDPTYAQQEAAISAMVDMLENTPFVERYAPYNWVEDVRRLEWDDGSLTAAGVTYRDKVSRLSYTQAMPNNGTRSTAQYLFDSSTLDSSGYGNNALASSAPAYTNGQNGQAIVLDGANNYVQLPANIASSNAFTFAAWVKWNGGGNWQRLFDFGNDTAQYLFLTPSASSGRLRFAIRNGGGEQTLESGAALPIGQWQHVCFTLSGGTGRLYTNGILAASGSISITPANFAPTFNYLGKSQFSADPLFNGAVDEVQIADYAFSAAQVASLLTNTPPQFSGSLINLGSAAPFVPFTTNISSYASDADAGGLTFSKASGPAWASIDSAGVLSGTPGSNNGGTNHITVRVTDTAGASAFATLAVYVPITYGSGTWIVDADGFWDDSPNWSGGAIPNGGNGANHTADFSTINITADRTVTLDNARNIGTLKFGDTSGAQNWTVVSDGPALTLDTGSATSPSIQVNQNTTSLRLPVDGTNGFTKSGSGTLLLGAANPLSGTVYIDTSLTSGSSGITRAAHPNALSAVNEISIRNNNGGTSTLQLDGTEGGVVTPAKVALSGRTGSSVSIQNLSGNNSIDGNITLNSGGSFYVLQSDLNSTLTLGGVLSASATGGRTVTFQGAGNFHVSGSIQNGSATNSFYKSGSGTLTLAGANTLTGTNRINGGILMLANTAALQTSTLDMNAGDSGQLRFSGITSAVLGGLIGTRGIVLTNSAGAPVALSVGGSGVNHTYSGGFSGAGSLLKTGTGTLTLSGVSTFTGTTRVNAGTLAIGNGLALQSSTLDLNAADSGNFSFGPFGSASIGGITGSRNLVLTNASGSAVTLNVGGNGQNNGYAGVLSGPGSLNKTGAGRLALSSASTYSGNTIVSAGTLALSRDPIVKFTFDSVGGGVVTNEGTAGSALNGAIINSTTGASFPAGKVGNALNLAGDGSYVSIPNRVTALDGSTPGLNWTLAMWIKTTQAGAGFAYQGDGGWGSGNTAFYLNQGNTTAGTRVGAVRWGGGWLTGNASVNNGQWRHIVIANNSGAKNIYIDGNLDASIATWVNASAGNQFWIGGTADPGDGVAKMNGQLDEVAIYNRALSLTEVRALTNTVPGSIAGSFGGQLPSSTALSIGGAGTFDLGGTSQTVASLSDYAGTGGLVTNSGSAPVTLAIAGNSGASAFSGTIADGALSNAISLVKNGASTTTLAGINTYRGTTSVGAGTLLVDGTLDSGAVTVFGSGVLGGNGIIGGPVTIQSGATLSPGTSVGRLTISNALALEAGSTTTMELSAADLTNDVLNVSGTMTCGGTLNVVNTAGTLAGGMSFRLFNAGTITDSFASVGLPALDEGLAWNFSPASGVLSVIATNPTTLGASLAGNELTLSWPLDHLGWRLQVQTNSLQTGLGTNWFNVPNTSGTNQVIIPVDRENGSVFYRLVYP